MMQRRMGMGHMGQGMGGEMMRFHHAQIPAPYAGMTNPITADEASLQRGAEIYKSHCAICHGNGGMGDGVGGKVLAPPPPAIAHTSRMLGDDYLFWRISEGGAGFETAMPGWKDALDEETRWDLVNYVRALGNGQMMRGHGPGAMHGARFDPASATERHERLVATAVQQGVITDVEAETFTIVHAALDQYLLDHPATQTTGNMAQRQAALLAELVKIGVIDQAQAELFTTIHERLLQSGLMQ